MISFEVTATGITEAMALLPDGPRREQTLAGILNRGRYVVLRHVMREMPVKTGDSRRRTTSDANGLVAHVTVMGGAAFAEEGVEPHRILPRNARMLRFVPGGAANPAARLTGRARRGQESAYVFALAVNHPGQPAQHFVQRALDDSMPEWKTLMDEGAAEMLRA